MEQEATQEAAPQADAPMSPEPQEGGFTSDALASDKTPTLPDQSILSERLQGITQAEQAIQQRRAQESQAAELQEELQFLRKLHGNAFQSRYNEVSGKIEKADDNQSQLMKKIQAELQQLRQGKDELANRLESTRKEQELDQFRRDTVSWVRSQKEHFPLINEMNEPQLVAQTLLEHQQAGRPISEVSAARHVEQQLESIVARLAPKLGYTKASEAPTDDPEEQVSIDNSLQITDTPLIKGSQMTDEQRLAHLMKKHNLT